MKKAFAGFCMLFLLCFADAAMAEDFASVGFSLGGAGLGFKGLSGSAEGGFSKNLGRSPLSIGGSGRYLRAEKEEYGSVGQINASLQLAVAVSPRWSLGAGAELVDTRLAGDHRQRVSPLAVLGFDGTYCKASLEHLFGYDEKYENMQVSRLAALFRWNPASRFLYGFRLSRSFDPEGTAFDVVVGYSMW
jgi:hypothetical protein